MMDQGHPQTDDPTTHIPFTTTQTVLQQPLLQGLASPAIRGSCLSLRSKDQCCYDGFARGSWPPDWMSLMHLSHTHSLSLSHS